MSRIPETALAAFVKAVRKDCGGDFQKILIRPVNESQVSVQWWPVGERDAEGQYVEVKPDR